MSAFIVISVKERLNWIVDGIKKCRPHNPEVATYISIGKIIEISQEQCRYEYTTYSKHDIDGSSDEVLRPTTEDDFPRNVFANQVAQLLHVCENEGEALNIFLLDNPLDDEDFRSSSWLVEEIKAIHERHLVTNIQLVRVLFSYKIECPADITRQASTMILKNLINTTIEDSSDFVSKILYVDNQNRTGAAICLDKEGHDLMIPRMLCDMMMLLSNKDDSYNTASAINGSTDMFALGYSECMYYHDDVFEYYNLVAEKDIREQVLFAGTNDDSLDYEKHPWGLSTKCNHLAPVYEVVEYTKNIQEFAESIDARIHNLVQSLKEQ